MIDPSVPSPSLLVDHSGPSIDPFWRGCSTGTSAHSNCSSRANSWCHHSVQRSLVLFFVGIVLALVLYLLQIQRNANLSLEEIIFFSLGSSLLWTTASVVGLLFPCIASHPGESHKFKRKLYSSFCWH